MNDNLPTVWPLDPHTSAKHVILKNYVSAWFPILSRKQDRFGKVHRPLFVDAFAGPGIYQHNEPGSPVIVLKAAQQQNQLPVPVEFVFIEKDSQRFASLENQVVAQLKLAGRKNIHEVICKLGDCSERLTNEFDALEKKGVTFGPALVFLDQFGYSQVPLSLIKRILKYPSCEVLSFLNFRDLNRWDKDPAKHEGISNALGSDSWKEYINLSEDNKRKAILDLYIKNLKSPDGAEYIQSFGMHDTSNKLIYWLLFCTNNIRGLEEMKRAMWNVDRSGSFRFSDADDPKQMFLFSERYTDRWLADEIFQRFDSKSVKATEVKRFVLVDTPCYKFKESLKLLEKAGDLKVMNRNGKAFSYPDDQFESMTLAFSRTPKQRSLIFD